MTIEQQNPPGDLTSPPADAPAPTPTDQNLADDGKLALDEFDKAMGDDQIASPSDEVESGKNKGSGEAPTSLHAIDDIPVSITVVLGRTEIEVTDLLSLEQGDIVELDRKVGEAVDIFVNNRLVARGEVVLVEDRLGITMTEIIKGGQVN